MSDLKVPYAIHFLFIFHPGLQWSILTQLIIWKKNVQISEKHI